MTNREALTNQKDVAMTCTMGNFEHWKYITFSYKSGINSEITLLNVSAIGGADFPNPAFARRFIVDIKLGSRSALVSLNFTEVFCQDEGLYMCTAYSTEQQITGNGALRVKGNYVRKKFLNDYVSMLKLHNFFLVSVPAGNTTAFKLWENLPLCLSYLYSIKNICSTKIYHI